MDIRKGERELWERKLCLIIPRQQDSFLRKMCIRDRYEDEDFRVILDLGPASRGHALILPKQHFADVCALDRDIAAKVLPLGAKIGSAMKKSLGCAGFNLVQNNGEAAGQTVFHFHMHVIPRYEGDVYKRQKYSCR